MIPNDLSTSQPFIGCLGASVFTGTWSERRRWTWNMAMFSGDSGTVFLEWGLGARPWTELSSLALPKKSVFSTMNMLMANRNLQFHRSDYLNMDPGLEDHLVLKSMLRCSLCFILHGHPWASYKFCGVSTRKCHASSPLHAELGSPSQQLQVD